tara:strand:+ start:948 stop:1166 length:219 start_codon:yes stop_codon:yes gene_type:complete
MEFEDYLRDPAWAGIIAGMITAGYIHFKAKINNEGKLPLSAYTKPATLTAILVFFIVTNGLGKKETISTEPF